MTDVYQCESTTDSQEEAQRIAHALVERRLAACVHVVGPIRSTYRWEGAVENEEEWLLRIKTTEGLVQRVKAAVAELHSYDEPELLVFAVADGSPGYLEWVRTETSERTP
ncbi:MAG: divalent-cation tolerance protein CutA [Actinomycetota bacterium]|nr:divalent-cation tolerance protein CutA [Actinomycetota bacterium]